jgi:hypothetical protein
MQERTMVPLQLDFSAGLDAWTIHGSPQDCVETIQWAQQEIGLEYIGFTPYSLPLDVQARIEYLHRRLCRNRSARFASKCRWILTS